MGSAPDQDRGKGAALDELGIFLANTRLFAGATPDEATAMTKCLDACVRSFEAGEHIHRMGDTISAIGLVLEGSVRIEIVDAWGNTSVIGESAAGQLFGETYAAMPNEPLMANAIAAEPCRIMFLPLSKVITTCSHACPFHARTSANLMEAMARRNLALSQRILHTAPKSLRGKILAYLSCQAERAGSQEFDIPFNRQQLAHYLNVDRSALSAELSRMAADGILETNRSHFKLLKADTTCKTAPAD